MPVDTKDLEPILDRIHEWTRSADTKVDILTAIEAGVVALLVPPLITWLQDPKTPTDLKLAFLVGFFFLVVALMKSLQALFPRTSPEWWRWLYNWWHGIKTPPASITYFGHISGLTLDDYGKKLATITEKDLREDWICQIHISAGIAGRKHHNIKLAILLFWIGLIIIAAAHAVMNGGWL